MSKIIFFDIDMTLMNRDQMMQGLYDDLTSKFDFSDSDIDEVKEIYKNTKMELGYFSPSFFIDKLYSSFPQARGKIDYFFKGENIKKFLFEDTNALHEMNGLTIGIFSKGHEDYQRSKLESFVDVIDEKNVFIFPEKIDHIKEVFEKYKDWQIYFVDDESNVLKMVKDYDPKITTIKINRKGSLTQEDGVDFNIINLFDIIPILNEKTS